MLALCSLQSAPRQNLKTEHKYMKLITFLGKHRLLDRSTHFIRARFHFCMHFPAGKEVGALPFTQTSRDPRTSCQACTQVLYFIDESATKLQTLHGSNAIYSACGIRVNAHPPDRRETSGQWPYIPASTRAMRNSHVVLYDLNYPNKYITPNDLGGHLTSDLKSATLITLVSICILPLTASEAMAASK